MTSLYEKTKLKLWVFEGKQQCGHKCCSYLAYDKDFPSRYSARRNIRNNPGSSIPPFRQTSKSPAKAMLKELWQALSLFYVEWFSSEKMSICVYAQHKTRLNFRFYPKSSKKIVSFFSRLSYMALPIYYQNLQHRTLSRSQTYMYWDRFVVSFLVTLLKFYAKSHYAHTVILFPHSYSKHLSMNACLWLTYSFSLHTFLLPIAKFLNWKYECLRQRLWRKWLSEWYTLWSFP